MLKIYNKHTYISINNGPWEQLHGQSTHMFEESGTEPEYIIFNNISFNECVNLLKQKYIGSLYLSSTSFLRKDTICAHYAHDSLFSTEYTKFDTISCKVTYTENSKYTLSYIMDQFPADQTIQYLKERGIASLACPMLNK